MVLIGANPITSMWGERSNFSMVLVGHQSVKPKEKKMQQNLGIKMNYIDTKTDW